MKKILFFLPSLGAGGAERVLVKLANYLSTQEYDVNIKVLFGGEVLEKDLLPNVAYSSVFKKSFRGNIHLFKLMSPKRLCKCIISDRYDIVVSFLEGPTTRILAGYDSNNALMINWVHTSAITKDVFLKSYRNEREFALCMQKYSTTIFVSEDCEQSFMRTFPCIGIKGKVLYNPIDEVKIKEKSKLERIVLPEATFNIVAVGRLMKVKGFERLIDVIAQLRDDGISVHLNILGDGSERGNLEKKILDHRLTENVTLHGFQPNPYPMIQASDLLVCSSYREGYSTTVVEALVLGIPVVTTDCAGMAEILGKNQEYGIVTSNYTDSLYQAIKKLAVDKNLYSHYKNQAVFRGKEFVAEKSLAAIKDYLSEE